jgi:hypothetical protein
MPTQVTGPTPGPSGCRPTDGEVNDLKHWLKKHKWGARLAGLAVAALLIFALVLLFKYQTLVPGKEQGTTTGVAFVR